MHFKSREASSPNISLQKEASYFIATIMQVI